MQSSRDLCCSAEISGSALLSSRLSCLNFSHGESVNNQPPAFPVVLFCQERVLQSVMWRAANRESGFQTEMNQINKTPMEGIKSWRCFFFFPLGLMKDALKCPGKWCPSVGKVSCLLWTLLQHREC